MSGLSRDERERLADALHDGIDGGRLLGAGKGIGMLGNDVTLSDARADEVVWWAVERVAPVVAAIAEERMAAERERIAVAIDATYATWRPLGGQQPLLIPQHSPAWLVERAYQDAARIARGER